jgi:Domain of unknown function (DUF4148)
LFGFWAGTLFKVLFMDRQRTHKDRFIPPNPEPSTKEFYMHTKSVLIAALAALAASTAMAETPEREVPYTPNSVLSRAEVAAEAVKAQASGQIAKGEQTFVASVPSAEISRAQVVAEAREAQRLGLIAHGEMTARDATASELEAIRMAGLAAARVAVAQASK